jgi:hypothetical protein
MRELGKAIVLSGMAGGEATSFGIVSASFEFDGFCKVRVKFEFAI